ncbi:unnamed protein product [Rotaria sp. Silwood2]|nr:unnamed protein product [Rotaria sp. Silwood2]CAF4347701.1 unnamed protein product [Rotaria sp. Silwood2]
MHCLYTLENCQRNFLRKFQLNQIRQKVLTLNIFDSASMKIDIIRLERFATRLYFILFFCTLSIQILYIVISKDIVSVSESMPSQARYEELQILHANTLQCTCTHVAIPYKKFITIDANFHQVCSSDFVQDVWLDFLFGIGFWAYQITSDIRGRGSAYFQLLSELCILSQITFNNAVDQFLEKSYVSAQVKSQSQFLSQMDIILEQFKITTPYRFSRALQLVRDITNGNSFISAYVLNWNWWVTDNSSNATVPMRAVSPNKFCSCGKRSDCINSGGIYRVFTDQQIFDMPGFHVGCSAIETLFRSTFECLYNQTCIDMLQKFGVENVVYFNASRYIIAMNPRLPSRFLSTTTILTIVKALFIEQWKINVSYSIFYEQCAPAYCAYIFEKRHDFIFIFTKLLGTYGGLTVALRFISPYMIYIVLKIKEHY